LSRLFEVAVQHNIFVQYSSNIASSLLRLSKARHNTVEMMRIVMMV
jgi:hypothetical protein